MYCLKDKVREIAVDEATQIPFMVRLLENPQSLIALPGNIDLYAHDCLHVLLNQSLSLQGEAFVIGFCMGSDTDTKSIHLKIFYFVSRFVYPAGYKFSDVDFINFKAGFNYGKTLEIKRINRLNFYKVNNINIDDIRKLLGIQENKLNSINQKVKYDRLNHSNSFYLKNLAKILMWSSSVAAVGGGFLLALNLAISGYGFLLLALSSFQLLISSWIQRDKSLVVYAGSVFIFVDLFGIYRWLLS